MMINRGAQLAQVQRIKDFRMFSPKCSMHTILHCLFEKFRHHTERRLEEYKNYRWCLTEMKQFILEISEQLCM